MSTINKDSIVLIPRTENRENRQKSYQTKQWRDLRLAYIQLHPLCELCGEDKVNPSVDVHHKLSPFEPNIGEAEKQRRLLDWNNLMALCKECHSKIHNEQNQKKKLINNKIITKRK